jgi:dCTP deaminase
MLVDYEIRALCEGATVPLISPFSFEQLQPQSYDVQVGEWLLFEREPLSLIEDLEVIYVGDRWVKKSLKSFSKEKPFLIGPGEFILTHTRELFAFPSDVCGQFMLKSSRGREGWDHVESAFIDGGWSGSLTLELKNVSNVADLPIYPGLMMGQISFTRTKRPLRDYVANGGRYSGDLKPELSKG